MAIAPLMLSRVLSSAFIHHHGFCCRVNLLKASSAAVALLILMVAANPTGAGYFVMPRNMASTVISTQSFGNGSPDK